MGAFVIPSLRMTEAGGCHSLNRGLHAVTSLRMTGKWIVAILVAAPPR